MAWPRPLRFYRIMFIISIKKIVLKRNNIFQNYSEFLVNIATYPFKTNSPLYELWEYNLYLKA